MSDRDRLIEILNECPEIEDEAELLLITLTFIYKSVEMKRRLKNGGQD